MYASLASTTDLTARGITWVSPDEDTLVDVFLSEASAAVREAAGVPISLVTSTVTLRGEATHWLPLPGPPIVSVATVAIDAETVTDFKLVDGRLWRACGWQPTCEPALVDVTFTHGFTDVPVDIVGMVCVMVAGALRAAKSDGVAPVPSDVVSVAIDDYRVQYSQDPDGRSFTLFTIPEHVRCALAARFGGGAGVVRPA